ncbi:MAG: integrase core domain-containing protein [Nitrospiraceae bacterium]
MGNAHSSEYERRYAAITLSVQGHPWAVILRRVQRSRGWLAKWLRRYHAQGRVGLRDASRTPRRIWRRTPAAQERRILAIRAELEAHRTRRAAFSGVGAETIQWELTRRGVRTVPSVATIERILARHGCTGRGSRPHRHAGSEPYPGPRAAQMGDLQQTDLVGPRYLRGPQGVTRFYSFHTVDVAGHTVATTQARDKQASTLCRHLVTAWQVLGVPVVSQMDNEMAATGGGRYPFSLSQVIRLHLLVGVHFIFIPPGSPGRQAAVESFNQLWQERVLRRHHCPTLAALRRLSQRFLRYYHDAKPHRQLTQLEHQTRFPGVLRERRWSSLRHVPATFRLAAYRNAHGRLHLPVAQGQVSWIRQVDGRGRIEVNGKSYFIRRRLSGQYVVATLFTHRQCLVMKQNDHIIKQFRFPIKETLVRPFVPRARRTLYNSSRCYEG